MIYYGGQADPNPINAHASRYTSMATELDTDGSEPAGTRAGSRPALLIDAARLAEMLDRSLTSVRRDDKAGRIPRPVTLNGSRRWRVDEILRWVDAGCPKRADWEKFDRPTRPKRGA